MKKMNDDPKRQNNKFTQDFNEKVIEVKEREKLFKEVCFAANDAIIMIGNNGKVFFWNYSAEKLFGYSFQEVVGKELHQLIIPKRFCEKFISEFKKFQDSGEGFTTEKPRDFIGVNKDGIEISIEITLSSLKEKDKWNAVAIIRDISNRKIIEAKLEASEKKYKKIVESIQIGYFEVNLEGTFTFLNESFLKIYDYSMEDLLGENYLKLVEMNSKEQILNEFKRVRQTDEPKNQLQFESIKKSGEKIYVETSINLNYDSDNHVIGYSGTLKDISIKKEIEDMQKDFQNKLEEEVINRTRDLNETLERQKLYLDQIVKASQFKTEFMATMSHELRTPLNAIIGFTELLLDGSYGLLNEDQLDYLKDIKSSAEHQFEMIQQILDISKIESGQLILNLQRFSLNTILEEIKSNLKPLYSNKKLEIIIKGLDAPKEIEADPIRFKEIIYNLLSNAIKFTSEGQITFDVHETYDQWVFKVRDTGIGIAKKDFNIIFKDFKRVDSSFVKSVPGTGLGLSLTKRLVNLHGGDITFTSVLGVGTTFTFTISKKKE